MKLVVTQIEPGVANVGFSAENLDASNVKAFREAVAAVTQNNGTGLIDMSALKFVDSSGLGALLACLRIMNGKNGDLRLYAMTKPVRALFELVRMHRIFLIFETREAALEDHSKS
jgi:anti-sigma B factor antagonist